MACDDLTIKTLEHATAEWHSYADAKKESVAEGCEILLLDLSADARNDPAFIRAWQSFCATAGSFVS